MSDSKLNDLSVLYDKVFHKTGIAYRFIEELETLYNNELKNAAQAKKQNKNETALDHLGRANGIMLVLEHINTTKKAAAVNPGK